MNKAHHHSHSPQTIPHTPAPPFTLTNNRLTLPKLALRPTRILALSALIIYILFPTQFFAFIISHPAFTSISDAGRRVLGNLVATSEQPAVSIVAACKNRHHSLRQALPTWLDVRSVREIILIDWDSQPPLSTIIDPPNRSKVKLVRVRNESQWVLSRAYNLGINLSTSPVILRIDCDYALAPDILRTHNVSALYSTFYAGNWLLARTDDEVHLNGIVLIFRNHFLAVGGYDERIQTYGWDDEDLYTRLQNANLTKANFSYDHVTHINHNDSVRAQEGVKFARVQIDVNRLLLEKLPPWSSLMYASHASQYRVIDQRNDVNCATCVQVEATFVPEPLRERIPASDYDDVWMLALGRRLADDHGIPWDVMSTMPNPMRERLLTQLFDMQINLNSKTTNEHAVTVVDKPRIIIIHCMGLLQNRLRVLISALSFAQATSRIPIVVWESDSNVSAAFGQLFVVPYLVILDDFQPQWPFGTIAEYDHAWQNFEFFNLVESETGGNASNYPVDIQGKQLYVRSDDIIVDPTLPLGGTDAHQVPTLLPQKEIRCCLMDLQRQGLKSAIGVYVQSQPLEEEVRLRNKKDRSDLDNGKAISQKGGRSAANFFAQKMTAILNEGNDTRFFVATETTEARSYLQSKFKSNMLISTRPECDHQLVGVKMELFNLLALSRCRRLLSSKNISLPDNFRKSITPFNPTEFNTCSF